LPAVQAGDQVDGGGGVVGGGRVGGGLGRGQGHLLARPAGEQDPGDERRRADDPDDDREDGAEQGELVPALGVELHDLLHAGRGGLQVTVEQHRGLRAGGRIPQEDLLVLVDVEQRPVSGSTQ